jgi:hypothetical protein
VGFVDLWRVSLITHTLVMPLAFFSKRIACLVKDHGLVILFFKEFKKLNLLVHFSQALLQILILCLELPDIFTIHNLLSSDADLRIRMFKINFLIFSLLLNDL